MTRTLTRSLLLALAASASLAVADPAARPIPNPAPAHPELRPVLDEFGGEAGLRALMDDFMVILLDDPRMRPFFENSDLERVKDKLALQFCVILGGDCVYDGMDMVTAHTGLDIRRADFNALVEDLQIAMEGRGIPTRAQNQLLAKLAPMHREVVNR